MVTHSHSMAVHMHALSRPLPQATMSPGAQGQSLHRSVHSLVPPAIMGIPPRLAPQPGARSHFQVARRFPLALLRRRSRRATLRQRVIPRLLQRTSSSAPCPATRQTITRALQPRPAAQTGAPSRSAVALPRRCAICSPPPPAMSPPIVQRLHRPD